MHRLLIFSCFKQIFRTFIAEKEIFKMKKFFITFILFSFVSVLIYGQEYKSNSIFPQNTDPISTGEKIKRLQFNTNIGSNFFYAGDFGSGSEFFAAPEMSYGLTPKLSLHGGMMFSYTSFFGFPNETESGNQNYLAYPGISLYGSASYQFSEKLSFYGIGIRHMSAFFPFEENDFNKPVNYSFRFGSNYKLGKNVTIGASIQVRDRSSYFSPFSGPSREGYYSPFYW